MKVLLVGDFPPPYGGIAVHVRQLHQFLRQKGVESHVIDIGKGAHRGDGVLPARSAPKLAAYLWQHAFRGWLLHLHTSGNNPMAWAVVAALGVAGRLLGTPRVVTLHSGLIPAYLASAANRAAAKLALEPYARVVAVSDAVRTALLECGVPDRKIVVHPAFMASQVQPTHAPEPLEEVRRRRAPLVAFAHHPSPVYGRDVMFRALKIAAEHLPDIGLAVFGPGTDEPEFRRAARAAAVEGLVEDFGELPHGAALALVQRCDVFVRPTTADGDAVSVREALALGVPCVASDAAPRPKGTRLFPCGDAHALARELTEAALGPRTRIRGPDAGPVLLEAYSEVLHRPMRFDWPIETRASA